MNHQNRPKPQPTDNEVERALAEVLNLAGMAFPKNAEDVEAMEEDVDPETVSTPDVEKLRRQLAGEPVVSIASVGSFTPFSSGEIAENLAMAARNGSTLSPEVRRLMDADRADHEKAKRQP